MRSTVNSVWLWVVPRRRSQFASYLKLSSVRELTVPLQVIVYGELS